MSEIIKSGVDYLKSNDPIIRKLIEEHGECNLKISGTYFKNLVKSIISQQLSVRAASTIFERLVARCESFTPENIKKLSTEELRRLGISYPKAKYIHSLADFSIENSEYFENINMLSNDEIVNSLCKIRGIGLWTAQMFLIFSLNRLDVLPLGDAGFRRSFKSKYRIPADVDLNSEILRISGLWCNFKSIAVWYLWKDLDNNK